MKKTVLSLSLALASSLAFAQQRAVFVEGFSQASCGPCAQQNPALNALLETNHSKVVSVKYQTSWPGVDPMNAQNPTEVQSRVTYYNITGVPDRILDGVNTDITQAAVNTRYAVASPITMDVSHSLSADFSKATFNLTITAPEIWNPANTVVHIAMVEKLIEFSSAPGTNGEKAFHNVMRKMYPSSAGTPIVAANFAAQNGTQVITLTDVAVPSYIYDISQIGFVAWVQNNTTKEVYQAAFSEPVLVPDYADVNGVATANAFSCGTDISDATVTIANAGNNIITAATVNYKIDAAAAVSFPFSGSIDVSGTADVIIPTSTVASGSHKITVWLTGINGSTSTKKFGETTIAFARISDAALTGNFSQKFTAGSFPYANYHLATPSATNWARVATNSGALKFAAYEYSPGSIGEVYIAPINMTTITDDSLFFDVAHARYDASYTEKLEVMVSTDCGATWTTVFDKSGTALSTAPNTTSAFTPTAAQWRKEGFPLANYATAEKVFIKFKATSGYGNNMYIDNIQASSVAGVNQLATTLMQVYPNPTEGDTKVNFTGNGGTYTISLTDLAGRTLTSTVVEGVNGVQTVDLATSGLSAGNYLVSISANGQVETQQLVIK